VAMKVLKWLDENIEKYTGMLAISMIILMLMVQVVSRYLFKYSVSFAEEAALMLFVIFTYLGASLAVKRRQHLRITVLVNRLSDAHQKLFGMLANLFFFAAIGAVTRGLIMVIKSLQKYKMVTPVMRIPKYLIYSILLGIMLITMARLIQDTVLLWKEYRAMRRASS
jgi:TRAP-type C4-dicarboxylate transport system permease small subunit